MKIGLIGFGKMGSSVFKLFAGTPHAITVVFRTAQKATSERDVYFKKWERSVKRKTLTQDELIQKQALICFTHDYEGLSEVDIVFENVTEDFIVKKAVLQQVESVVTPAAIMTTDTSSISIKQIADNLKYPDRFCGFHFFHPIPLINLVEIIGHDRLSDEVVASLKQLSSGLNRSCIVAEDAPGSVLNAILTYYYMEALYILEEGLALPSKLDEISRKLFYVGPCESMDVIGIDFMIEAMTNGLKADTIYPIKTAVQFGSNISRNEKTFHIPSLLTKLPSEKRFGKKTSAGLYRYEKEIPVDEDSTFYIEPSRAVIPFDGSDDFIMDRLLYSIFHGILFSLFYHMASADDLNIGVKEILQMKNGPMAMMKNLGAEKVDFRFKQLSEKFGRRFAVPNQLIGLIK